MTLRFKNSKPAQIAPVCVIRRGHVADASTLAAFAARTFVDTYGAYNRPEDLRLYLDSTYGVHQQARELADPNIATLLACRDGEVAAFAQIMRGPAPPCVDGSVRIELHRLYVDKTWHGLGVAGLLMTQACRAALAFGGTTLWLKVWERNARALAFYRKSNFADVGTTDFHVGTDRQTDRVLVMDLRGRHDASP